MQPELGAPLMGLLLAGLVSFALLGLGRVSERPWLVALALPLAFIPGRLGLGPLPRFPPLDAMDWLVFLAPFAPVLAAPREDDPDPLPTGGLVWAGLAAGLLVEAPLSHRLAWPWIFMGGAGLAALGVVVYRALLAGARGPGPRRTWITAAIMAFLLAFSLGITGSVRLWALGLALFAAALPLPLLASPGRGLSAAAAGFALLFVGLAASGVLLSSTPPVAALLLCLGLAELSLPRTGWPSMLGLLLAFIGFNLAIFEGVSRMP